MLITCPACGARYEVDAALIPAGGRTVRCSACRAEWTWRPDPVLETAREAEVRSAGGLVIAAAPAPAPAPFESASRRPAATMAADAAAPPRAAASMVASLDEDDDAEGRKGGAGAFMAGFAVVALFALAAVVVYAQRAEIAAVLPALAPWVEAYAAFVDRLRAALADAAGLRGAV
jgi:predicted Zn finger-like uncharacterized protein